MIYSILTREMSSKRDYEGLFPPTEIFKIGGMGYVGRKPGIS
jgi:hypothetical protein